LACSFNQLTSLNLTGLTALTVLDCSENYLTSINVSGLTSLTSLNCHDNYNLTALNLTGLIALTYLDCSNCHILNSLIITGLTTLETLYCGQNSLTSLNLTGLTAIKYLNCNNNQLTSLNVSGITNLISLDCRFNTDLSCITVSNTVAALAQPDWQKDATANYSTSCNTTPAPTANAQTLNTGSTVANLAATGSNLQWYTAASGGTALATSTVLTTGTYYVSQTVNGVESPRTLVVVTIANIAIPTSKVKANQCGTTLTSLDQNINADYVAGYQQYRFEVTNGATVNTVDVNKYNFSLTQTPGITYGITYGVRVAVKMGGTWGAYGVSCNITTPSLASSTVLTTHVHPNFCGTTLAALTAKIPAKTVHNATGYRFEITIGGVTTVYDSSTYFFQLSQAGVTVDYGLTYTIRVAAFVNGVYGDYGASCTVSTPTLATNSVPTTQVHPAFCGATLATLDTKIPASTVLNATGYRFEITTGGVTTVYDSASYIFKLLQAGVVVANGTTYAIRVAAKVNGVYGNYGASCNIYTPGATAREIVATTEFAVSVYPNPFATVFNLNVETPSKEDVTIAVYDMMGKLVETHQVSPTEVANLQIGSTFSKGIYNIIVSQANEMKAIRLVRN